MYSPIYRIPQFNIPIMIMLWTSGLLICFFGLYSFIEREVKGAYERRESLRELEKKLDGNHMLIYDGIKQAVDAQEAILQLLGKGRRRILLIHLPGVLVGINASLSVLFFLLHPLLWPSLGNFLYTLSMTLLIITVLSLSIIIILGTIYLSYIFLKNEPERKFFEVILELDRGQEDKPMLRA